MAGATESTHGNRRFTRALQAGVDENPEYWQRLRREQENVVSTGQILGQGLTENVIRANVAAGRWVPLFRGTYALVTGEPTASMWRRAALLFCPGPAMLSHASAAAVLGLRGGADSGPVHLTVPYTSSARGCPGIVAHRSRAFAHLALPGFDPPVTSKVHTLIDLAVEAPTAREAMRRLTAGATAGRVAGEHLRAAIELRRPRRYRQALLDAATLLIEGIMSVLEADHVLAVERAHGLPAADRQVPHVVDGRRIAEDFEYDLPGGKLTVRVDGWTYHRNREVAYRDRARDNAAELKGRARMVFGTEEIHGDPCGTARTITRRLRQLGWLGTPRACGACEQLPW